MSVPYNNDTRDSYVERMKAEHLAVAELHYDLKNASSMWLQMLIWAQAEDIYGAHWDRIKEKKR